jgi:hypothetical protein
LFEFLLCFNGKIVFCSLYCAVCWSFSLDVSLLVSQSLASQRLEFSCWPLLWHPSFSSSCPELIFLLKVFPFFRPVHSPGLSFQRQAVIFLRSVFFIWPERVLVDLVSYAAAQYFSWPAAHFSGRASRVRWRVHHPASSPFPAQIQSRPDSSLVHGSCFVCWISPKTWFSLVALRCLSLVSCS